MNTDPTYSLNSNSSEDYFNSSQEDGKLHLRSRKSTSKIKKSLKKENSSSSITKTSDDNSIDNIRKIERSFRDSSNASNIQQMNYSGKFKITSGKKSESDNEIALINPMRDEKLSEWQQGLLLDFNKLEINQNKFLKLITNGKKYIVEDNPEEFKKIISRMQSDYNNEISGIITRIYEKVNFDINGNDNDKYLSFPFLTEEGPYIKINRFLNELTLKVNKEIEKPEQVITDKNLLVMKNVLGIDVVKKIFPSDEIPNKKKLEELSREKQLDKELENYRKAVQLLDAMHEELDNFCRILRSETIPWEKAQKNKGQSLKSRMKSLSMTPYCREKMIKIAKALTQVSEQKKGNVESIHQMMDRVANAFQKYLNYLDSSIKELIKAQVKILENIQRERNITPSFNYHNYCEAVKNNTPLPEKFPSSIFTDYQRVVMGGYVYYIDDKKKRHLIDSFIDFKKNLSTIIDQITLNKSLPKDLPNEYHQWKVYSNFVDSLLAQDLESLSSSLKQQAINLYVGCNLECAGYKLFNDRTLFADLTTELYQLGAKHLEEMSSPKENLGDKKKTELDVHANNFKELVKIFNEEKRDPKKKEQNDRDLTFIMEKLQARDHKISSLANLRKQISYVLLFYSAPNQDLLLNDTKIFAQLYETAFNEKLQSAKSLNWSDANTKNISFLFDDRFGCRLMRRSPLTLDNDSNPICYLIKKMEIYVPDPSKVGENESLSVDISIQYFYEAPHQMSDENRRNLDKELRRLNLICDATGYPRIQKTNYELGNME